MRTTLIGTPPLLYAHRMSPLWDDVPARGKIAVGKMQRKLGDRR